MKYNLLKIEQKEEKDSIKINSDDLIDVNVCGFFSYLNIRASGEFTRRAIWLSDKFDWTLGRDSRNQIILVPLKKIVPVLGTRKKEPCQETR